jgi:uncharacterized protein with GYD domain
MMDCVVRELSIDRPITLNDIQNALKRMALCNDINEVTLQHSYLTRGGEKLVCVFEAEDAEAVRRVTRQLGFDTKGIWPATMHGTDIHSDQLHVSVGTTTVLVERSFEQPTKFSDVQDQESAAAWCLETYYVRFLRSYFSLNQQRMLCIYEAPDAEAVRHTQKTAKMTFSAVWPSVRILYREDGTIQVL